MAVLATIWGIRLTWNFNRRGGYTFPKFWLGEEDYRWLPLRKGEVPYFEFCAYPIPWLIFNLTFISLYQNLLLWLIASPILAALPSPSCGASRLPNKYDSFLSIFFLCFVALETFADNEQWHFQIRKKELQSLKIVLAGDIADGFNQSGLYSVVRKPNYAAEQCVWIVFYLFSVNATGKAINWSLIGCFLLCTLFQASGWM
jgi:steroid 5-alpha reductase family enzyme